MTTRTTLVAWLRAVMLCPLFAILCGVTSSAAHHNLTPIGVPLLGTQGPAGPYPSTIDVVALNGASEKVPITVILHGVTHPCPDELAVLLVHNGTEKYLLMSNAGGCRPLQGTMLFMRDGAPPIPDDQPASPAYSDFHSLGASNYGAVPTFPAPAPPGPYTAGMPPSTTTAHGRWDLYVIDTVAGNRGSIEGWSFHYLSTALRHSQQTDVEVPASGTSWGPAGAYPITFDFNDVPLETRVADVVCRIRLNHTYPDDLRIVLESPYGVAVALMINAGGNADLPAGSYITFADGQPPVPNSTAIASGFYAPGSVYGTSTNLGAPAPQGPYETTFGPLLGHPMKGTWKLWVFDDTAPDGGVISNASLFLDTEFPPNPTLTFPTETETTSTQPFMHVVGNLPTSLMSPHTATWRVTNAGEFYAAGAFALPPGGHQFSADVPLKRGVNTVTWGARNTWNQGAGGEFTVTVEEFTYSLAEGATGSFFDLDVRVANPMDVAAPIAIDFLREGGSVVPYAATIAPATSLVLPVDSVVPDAAVSTIVHSIDAVPLAVERTMIWDAGGYGGHGGSAVAPHRRWLFAEGSQGYFSTYVLLANQNASSVNVLVKFLLEGGGVVEHAVAVPASARITVDAGSIPALVNRSFGIDIIAAAPIIAERAMYLPGARLFEGGHESAGVNEPSTHWFLAEGATGPFFECFVLLSNPHATPATVNLSYLLPTGATISQGVTVPANGRHTINIETVDEQLVNAAVSTTIVSNIGIVVERAMYWPDLSIGWREAHNSFGVTAAALRWGVADGRVGGPRGYTTYILLANPNPREAEVQVRFFKPGLSVTRTYVLNPTSRWNIWVNNDVPELGDGTFSADVQVLNNQPIVAEKALYWNADGVAWAGGTNVTATRLPPP